MKCFEHNKHFNNKCQKKSCRYWINCAQENNCAIIAAKNDEKLTLEDVGKLFNVTRMRICQIEKIAVKKLKEKVFDILN
tara:strand:+ start:579 stop:815 length:237 start_codon:yes stop_codon:yes gene_type:complete